jgi:hypothetical protein
MMGQELQRRSANHLGFTIVDLPAIFAAYTNTPLPGRQLFLDYCHLTVEGMKIAMAATTAAVLRLFDTEYADLTKHLEYLPDPDLSAGADATAKFGAAIHNAHRLLTVGPKAPILEYWCQEALDTSPSIEQAMLDLIAARLSPCPAVMTRAQQQNYTSPSVSETVGVSINGFRIAYIPLEMTWTRANVRVGQQKLQAGLNRITLHWPIPSIPGEKALETVLQRLEQGREASLHPIFGEVFSLIVTTPS